MTFVDEGNGIVAWVTSDGYRTFLLSRLIPEKWTSKIWIKIWNTYAWNLHIGVVGQYDFNQANKFTDFADGFGLFIKEFWAWNNNNDGQ